MKLAEGTFTGLHPDEVALFRTHLKGVKGTGVEIGCLDGYSSAVILDASELFLISMDPFIPDSMEASLVGSKARYLENVGQFPGRFKLDEGYSHEFAKYCAMGPIWRRHHFLFIDGDHRYEEVLRDFNDWTPFLMHNGLLAIHDARMGRDGGAPFHDGPSRVAREMIFDKPDEWEVLGEAFSLVIARKKGPHAMHGMLDEMTKR